MALSSGKLGVRVEPPVGVGYELPDAPVCFIPIGGRVSQANARDLGICVGELTERHLAFLLLLILDRDGELGPRAAAENDRSQRRRFGGHLGLTERGLAKWLELYLTRRSGRILRWDHTVLGRQPSKTGGPWLLDVTKTVVLPDAEAATEFIAAQRATNTQRASDPAGLLGEALTARDAGRWTDALATLEEADRMFRRRRWSRETPLRFEILLVLAGTEMQLGTLGLAPYTCHNIHRSVSRQRLGGPRADLIRAQAHYIAALVHNQGEDPASVRKVLAHIERAKELLEGRTDHEAVREYWRYRSYRELTESRRTGTVRPKTSSAILQAGHVIGDSYDQKQMRYGEALLTAGRPSEAIDYIRPAIESGRLSKPAWIIAERLDATARWGAGARPAEMLETLTQIEKQAANLGFAHQVRVIQQVKERIRRGRPSASMRRPQPAASG